MEIEQTAKLNARIISIETALSIMSLPEDRDDRTITEIAEEIYEYLVKDIG